MPRESNVKSRNVEALHFFPGLYIRVYFTFQDLKERERAEEGQRSAVGVLKQTLELYKEQPRPSGASGAEPR